ncbi:hypothetical protein UPYG_G00238040 [Umbra pygmaea]|uniref:HECT domain-containing protein n=1 Tax=Umbra pygmaea TaxID=75934 RepID=A0ABD0WER4_UMBPY
MDTSLEGRDSGGSAGVLEECVAGPSGTSAPSYKAPEPEWKNIHDPLSAALHFRKKLLEEQERSRPLCFFVDLHDSVVDRNKSIVSFYKAPKVNWASPLHCTLEGDAAIGDGVNRHFISMSICALQRGFHMNYGNTDVTLLFEGQPDHLVPCTSQVLVDSDLFLVAGRMVGHAFLHGGPALSGISSAVVDVLFGASPETTTITLEDCPDIDQRLTISLLEGEKELSDEDKAAVWALADVWDLPGVLGRTAKQIKQFRKGIRETGVWPLLTERRDVVQLMYPRTKDAGVSPEILLDQIVWPHENTHDEEDDDEGYPLETKCRISGFLRHFVETASQQALKELLRFWTGWEVLSTDLQLEVVKSNAPKASTCFKCLRIPGHYTDYKDFSYNLQACIATCDTGFGLI